MLVDVLQNVVSLQNFLLILIGVAVGNVFGAIPGLNAPIAVALALPITFTLETMPAISLLMGLYMGCVSGGLVSATLLRIPGTAASVATTFDGYPMAQQGRATEALSIGSFASLVGGLFSFLCLVTLAPVLSKMAVGFGPWEYFATASLALVLVCVMLRGRTLKAFIALFMGLLLRTVGISPVDGIAARYTFGSYNMESGFNLIVVIIGVFALPEIVSSIAKLKEHVKPLPVKPRLFYLPAWGSIRRNIGTMLRGSVLGTFIGILPGMGGGAASLISYAQAKRSSKHPERFGTGIEEGIYSCESANNATTGGALIPMLALGVPGDTVTAILMGALALQGLTPGPLLSLKNETLFRSIIYVALVANIFMFVYQIMTIRYVAKVTEMKKSYLFPWVTVFCVTGVISIKNNVFDLIYLMAFGIIGYVLDKNDYPISPFILAFVLGRVVEENLRRSVMNYGSFLESFSRFGIGSIFVTLAVVLPIVSIVNHVRRERTKDAA